MRPFRICGYLLLFFLFFGISSAYAAATIPFTINLTEPVNVTGTPRVQMDVGGATRYATYTSGAGSSALVFTYTMTSGDVDADGVTLISPIQLNGGTIKDLSGNNADLNFTPPNTSGVIVNAAVPSGYSVAFTADTVTNVNKSALSFTLTYPKANKTLNYSIASSNGGTPITGAVTTTAGTTTVNSINATTLPDGKLTLSAYLTDTIGGTGATVTDTIPMAVLDNTLIGQWTFDAGDISGTTAFDRSGQGNDGTLTNGPTQITGKVGGALNFDGANDFVDINNDLTYRFGTANFSVVAYLKTTSAGTVIAVGKNSGSGSDYWFGYSSGRAAFSINGATNQEVSPYANNNIFHLIVGVRSSGVTTIYVDGVAEQSMSAPGATNPGGNLRIGRFGTASSFYFPGAIDEVRVYNRALTATEITNIYNSTQ